VPYDFERRLARALPHKVADLERNGRLKHAIFARQFNRDTIDHLCEVADMIRDLARTSEGAEFLGRRLAHRRAMLYFTQPSTRTFLSFMASCQLLGLTCNEIRDPRLSSEYKGETPFDSVRMFSSYFDILIMRSRIPNLAECCAYLMNDLDGFNQRNVPIVNGGSGSDEHPTQALLDIYTARRTFAFSGHSGRADYEALKERNPGLRRGLANKTYAFCGDVGRGRTVRSLATLLTMYEGVKLTFVSPNHERLSITPEFRRRLTDAGAQVYETDDLDEVIEDIDLLYMTRIQHEYDNEADQAFFAATDMGRYKLTPAKVARMKEYAAIMHPFPRNDEIPVELDTDKRSMYFRQARNGVWIRAALIAYLFDAEAPIMSKHRSFFREFSDYNSSRR